MSEVINKTYLHEAIDGLNSFTKQWCIKNRSIKLSQYPEFRCNRCIFRAYNDNCLIKVFAYQHSDECNYDMDTFGSMHQL